MTTNSACAAMAGKWFSPYDDAAKTALTTMLNGC